MMLALHLFVWLPRHITCIDATTVDDDSGAALTWPQKQSGLTNGLPKTSVTPAHLRSRYWGEVDRFCSLRTRRELGYEGPIVPPEYGSRNGEARYRNSHAPRSNHCRPGETWHKRVCVLPAYGEMASNPRVIETCLSAQGFPIARQWQACPNTHICESESEPDIDGRISADCIYNPEESRRPWFDNLHDMGAIDGTGLTFDLVKNKNGASSSTGQTAHWCIAITSWPR